MIARRATELSFHLVSGDVFTVNHSPQTPHALFKVEPFPPFLVRRSQLQWLIALSDSKLVSVTLELGLSKTVIALFRGQMPDCGGRDRMSGFCFVFLSEQLISARVTAVGAAAHSAILCSNINS